MARGKRGQRTPYQLRVAAENLEKNARQANKVLELLRQDNTQKRIQQRLKITPQQFKKHVATLRGGLREQPKWLPEKGVQSWTPGKAKRIKRFIDFAAQQIQERTLVREAQKRAENRLPSKKHSRIMDSLKANPAGTNVEKARKTGVSWAAVETRRRLLEARGAIPVTDPRERARLAAIKKIKPSGFLKKERREEILAEKAGEIRKKAFNVYRKAQDAFDFDNVLPEKIAEELRKRLELRLQTFRPGEMQGPEETKLERHFNFQLKRIGKDMERTALRRHSRIKAAGKKISMENENRAKTGGIREEFELGVEKLDEICRMLRLRQDEKAVAYGVVLDWTDKRIGKAIGYSKGGVLSIRHRIGKALERLKRQWKR